MRIGNSIYSLDEFITDLEDIIVRIDQRHFPQRAMERRLDIVMERDRQYTTNKRYERFINGIPH